MTHRRAKPPVPRAAHVAALAAVAAAASAASAQLVYEPFAYSGSTLDGQVNPGNALPWSPMSADAGDDNILLNGSNLAYGGLAASTGGSVTYDGAGKSERLALGPVVTSGTLYYSLLLNVTSKAGLTATPVFIAGFSNRSGASDLQPTAAGTRLYLREAAGSTPQNPLFNVGVSKNSGAVNDVTFSGGIYGLNTPLLIVGSYEINPAGVDDDVARLYVNPTSLGTASPPAPTLTAPVNGTDLLDETFTVPSVAGFVLRQAVANVPGVQVDELRVDATWAQVTPPAGVSWNVNSNGFWSDGGNWSGNVAPDGPDAFVNFPAVTNAVRTVTLNTPVSARTLNFASGVPYVIEGAQPINFSTSAAINVMGGSHTVSAPITLAGDFLASVGSGSTLTLTGDLGAPASTVTKAGAGTLVVKNLAADTLAIAGGTVQVAPNGSPTGATAVRLLNLTPGTRLDLTDNDLVVRGQPVGTFSGSAYTGISGLVQSARNGGNWAGSGILTSAAAAPGQYTTLGVASAAQAKGIAPGETAIWNGQTVTGTDTLVMYTYGGDTNLDGKINIDDYGHLDTSIGVGKSGWFNGDFNYDGKINIDDYGIIDVNVGIQGSPLGSAPEPFASPVSSVPEPGTLAPIVTTVALLRRRRRKLTSTTARWRSRSSRES